MGNQANQHNFPIEKGFKKLLNLSTRSKKKPKVARKAYKFQEFFEG